MRLWGTSDIQSLFTNFRTTFLRRNSPIRA